MFQIAWEGAPQPTPDAPFAVVYERATGKVLGRFHRGEKIARPFDQWQVVRFNLNRPGGRCSVLVMDVAAKCTWELFMTYNLHERNDGPVWVATPATQP